MRGILVSSSLSCAGAFERIGYWRDSGKNWIIKQRVQEARGNPSSQHDHDLAIHRISFQVVQLPYRHEEFEDVLAAFSPGGSESRPLKSTAKEKGIDQPSITSLV